MTILTDQLGNQHQFEKYPQRILSLVPSQTELLYDLNLGPQIVGLTKFCVHPDQFLKTKVVVGGTKQVNFDKIKALQPDIIIANKEENSLEIVTELTKICPVWVTNVNNLNDNIQMIIDFGQLLERAVLAQILVDKIRTAQIDFENFISTKPQFKIAYFIWANPYMVAANLTFINELLALNKFTNVFKHLNRYPEINLEQLTLAQPDCIFLSSEPYPFKEKQKCEIQKFTNASIIYVDGEFFSWHGSRILKAFDYFKAVREKIEKNN